MTDDVNRRTLEEDTTFHYFMDRLYAGQWREWPLDEQLAHARAWNIGAGIIGPSTVREKKLKKDDD